MTAFTAVKQRARTLVVGPSPYDFRLAVRQASKELGIPIDEHQEEHLTYLLFTGEE